MKVIQIIQSNDPFHTGEVEAPVEVIWYNGDSLAQAMSALANATAGAEDEDKMYSVLSVRIDIASPKV